MKIFKENFETTSWLFLLLFAISGVKALKSVAVSVPYAVNKLETVRLQCKYDLEGEPLYTVKWYKEQNEFFRYIPKEYPETSVFPVPGMNIDIDKSGPNDVVLKDVSIEITGRYFCEVSADAPSFDTQKASSFMYVVDYPNDNPIMDISKVNFGYGYILRANCTTPPSFPPMNVTWYINGIKVNEIDVKRISLDSPQKSSKVIRPYFMTISYMEKEIDDSIYQGEVVKVQCIATLFNLYRGENVRYIDDNRPQPWPSSVIGTTKNISCAVQGPTWLRILLFLCIFILQSTNE